MRFLQALLLCAALLACADLAAADVPPDLRGVRIPSAGEKLIGRFYTPALRNPEVPASYRGTSLIRNSAPLGPYSRNMPRALWWS